MTLWVKEYNGLVSYSQIKKMVKSSISVERYDLLSKIDPLDIIVVSKSDTQALSDDYNSAMCLVFEDVFDLIGKSVTAEFDYRYDYYYLRNQIQKAKTNQQINTIITGSSYALFGIEEKLLDSSVKLALMSQDLYYSIAIAKDVIRTNNRIKNIVLCCSYYYFSSDLSLTQNDIELSRLSKVYYPILGDLHNCAFLFPKREYLPLSNIFDCDMLFHLYMNAELSGDYFSQERSRKALATFTWEGFDRKWSDLSKEEKGEAASIRANQHNKSIKHGRTFIENKLMFDAFSLWCEEQGVRLIVIAMPMTRYYMNAFDPEFRTSFYEVLDSARGTVEVVDLTESDLFTDHDFNDADHLNDEGAMKLSDILHTEFAI